MTAPGFGSHEKSFSMYLYPTLAVRQLSHLSAVQRAELLTFHWFINPLEGPGLPLSCSSVLSVVRSLGLGFSVSRVLALIAVWFLGFSDSRFTIND